MRSIPLLPSLPGLLSSGLIAPDRVRFIVKVELNSELLLK